MDNSYQNIEKHLREFWKGRLVTCETVKDGPVTKSIPGFSVLRFSDTVERPYWIYCTLGCFRVDSGHHRYEFFLLSAQESSQHVLTLSMLANFHADPRYRLGPGSIVEIGDPWIPGSSCDHLLISLPYTFGAKLEWLQLSDFCARVLWALPITRREAEYAHREGIEPLEQKFDEVVLPYLDVGRHSVI
jgi:Suppressor of fused protein (SUFU)